MSDLYKRCVVLKNLPPSCDEVTVREELDLAHGDFCFKDRYEKLHRHIEFDNDIRWIVLFKSKQDAVDCKKNGEWDCTIGRRRCRVTPDYCLGCIIPDEWTKDTFGEEVVWNMPISFNKGDELFHSFVKVKSKTNDDHTNSDDDGAEYEEVNVPNFGSQKANGKQINGVPPGFGQKTTKPSSPKIVKFHNDFETTLYSDLDSSGSMLSSGNHREESNISPENEVKVATRTNTRTLSFCDSLHLSGERLSSGDLFGSGGAKMKTEIKYRPTSDKSEKRNETVVPKKLSVEFSDKDEESSIQSRDDFGSVGGKKRVLTKNQSEQFHSSENKYDHTSSNAGIEEDGKISCMSSRELFDSGNRRNKPSHKSPDTTFDNGGRVELSFDNDEKDKRKNYQGDIQNKMTEKDDVEKIPPRGLQHSETMLKKSLSMSVRSSDLFGCGSETPDSIEIQYNTENDKSAEGCTESVDQETKDHAVKAVTSNKHQHQDETVSAISNSKHNASNDATPAYQFDPYFYTGMPYLNFQAALGMNYARYIPMEQQPGQRFQDDSSQGTPNIGYVVNPMYQMPYHFPMAPVQLNEKGQPVYQFMPYPGMMPPIQFDEKGKPVTGQHPMMTPQVYNIPYVPKSSNGIPTSEKSSGHMQRDLSSFTQASRKLNNAPDGNEVIQQAQSGVKFSPSGCRLEVSEYHPPLLDPLKIFIRDIAETTTSECVTHFLAVHTKTEPTTVVFGETPGTVMAYFDTAPDVPKLRQLCDKRKCEGRHWKIVDVEVTRSAKATGMSTQTTEELLSLYFENKKRSQGGDVEAVEYREEFRDFIVTFVHAEDAERVCNTRHKLSGKEFTVSPFFPCLELNEDFVVRIPPTILLDDIEEYIVKFIVNSKKYKADLESKIQAHFGNIIWPSREKNVLTINCTVDPSDTNGNVKVKNWTKKCTSVVKEVTDGLIVVKSSSVAMEAWTHIKGRLQEIEVKDPESIAVFLESNVFVIVFAGEKEPVRAVEKQLQGIISVVEKNVEKERQIITKKRILRHFEMALVRASKFESTLEKMHMEFSIDNERAELTFKGMQKDVEGALAKLDAKLKSFVKKTVPGMSKQAIDLLFKKEARDTLKRKMHEKKVIGVLDVVKGTSVMMYSKNEKELNVAVEVLQSSVVMDSFELDPEKKEIIESRNGNAMIAEFEENHKGCVLFTVRQNEFSFVCVVDIQKEIRDEFTKLFDLHSVICKTVTTEPGIFSYIVAYKKREIEAIEKQYKRLSVLVEIKDTSRRPGFVVKGKKDGCKLAVNKLQTLLDTVVHEDHTVSWPGFDKFIQSSEGRDTIRTIELNEKCVIKISSEELNLDKEYNTTIDQVSVSIVKDDLTTFTSGAIVNSTTDDLNLSSGAISKAILAAAGYSIQNEALAGKNRFLAHGLVVTSPGKLMCQNIIHVRARNGLGAWAETIKKCLVVSETLGLNSIAFPALGTGGKGVSPDQMARIMIEAFRDYIKSSDFQRCLKTIKIVIFEERMLDVFISEIKATLDPEKHAKWKSYIPDLKFCEKKPTLESTPSVTIHIYSGSPYSVDIIVRKVDEIRKEKVIFVPSSVRDHMDETLKSDLRRIGYSNGVKVDVDKYRVKVMGYAESAEIAHKRAQVHIDSIENDIRKGNTSSSVKLPSNCTKMKLTDPAKIVMLMPGDADYRSITRKFLQETSYASTSIVKIERIQNPTLFTQYTGKKKQIEIHNSGGRPVEQLLWHGTKSTAVENIKHKGFDRNYNSGSSHGVGVYFAVNAATSASRYCSPDANGYKHIFLAHVLTGEYCVGQERIRVPPTKTVAPYATYDSTTDNVQNPNFFVIFHDAQAYPSFLITFK